jgi:hypothetical protein
MSIFLPLFQCFLTKESWKIYEEIRDNVRSLPTIMLIYIQGFPKGKVGKYSGKTPFKVS